MRTSLLILILLMVSPVFAVEVPKIENVEMAEKQPHKLSDEIIWYDSFDKHDPSKWIYMEPSPKGNTITTRESLGGKGGSMELFYAKGKRGKGNRKLVFGDSPTGRPLRRGEQFREIYYRIYVKHQKGWTGGGPSKMSRAMSLA